MKPDDDSLISTRKSRFFFPAGDGLLEERVRNASFDGFYTSVLYEDLGRIMPFEFGRSADCRALVVGSDSDRAWPIIERGISQTNTRTLSDALEEFVDLTARKMIFAGSVTYEVTYFYVAENQGERLTSRPVAFSLDIIDPSVYSTLNGMPIQYVPATMRDSVVDPSGLRYISLEKADLVTFQLGAQMAQSVASTVGFLKAVNNDNGSGSRFFDGSRGTVNGYDFKEHQRRRAALFMNSTQVVGYNFRGLFEDQCLAPYSVWRQLRFLKFLVDLRDSILGQLDVALANIAKRIGFDARIETVGLVTRQDIDAAFGSLELGRLSLNDLMMFANQIKPRHH